MSHKYEICLIKMNYIFCSLITYYTNTFWKAFFFLLQYNATDFIYKAENFFQLFNLYF